MEMQACCTLNLSGMLQCLAAACAETCHSSAQDPQHHACASSMPPCARGSTTSWPAYPSRGLQLSTQPRQVRSQPLHLPLQRPRLLLS